MKCPLFCIGDKRVQLGEETEYGDCLERACAWWHKEDNCCCISALPLGLLYIFKILIDLAEEKLPKVQP